VLILGIVLLVVGVVELVVVTLIARRQMAAAGLGEGSPPPPAMGVLRRTAMIEIGAGVLLTVIGLVS